MKPTVQAVTITDDGQEVTRKVTYVERQALTLEMPGALAGRG